MHTAPLAHLMDRVSGALGGQDAVPGHGVAVVDGHRAAGEVTVRIAEFLQQVLLAAVLVLPLHRLDGGQQGRPFRYVRRPDRPPAEIRR